MKIIGNLHVYVADGSGDPATATPRHEDVREDPGLRIPGKGSYIGSTRFRLGPLFVTRNVAPDAPGDTPGPRAAASPRRRPSSTAPWLPRRRAESLRPGRDAYASGLSRPSTPAPDVEGEVMTENRIMEICSQAAREAPADAARRFKEIVDVLSEPARQPVSPFEIGAVLAGMATCAREQGRHPCLDAQVERACKIAWEASTRLETDYNKVFYSLERDLDQIERASYDLFRGGREADRSAYALDERRRFLRTHMGSLLDAVDNLFGAWRDLLEIYGEAWLSDRKTWKWAVRAIHCAQDLTSSLEHYRHEYREAEALLRRHCDFFERLRDATNDPYLGYEANNRLIECFSCLHLNLFSQDRYEEAEQCAERSRELNSLSLANQRAGIWEAPPAYLLSLAHYAREDADTARQ